MPYDPDTHHRRSIRLKGYDYTQPGLDHYPHVQLDVFAVMPNHVHGIIVLTGTASHPLPEMVRAFKSFAAQEVNQLRGAAGIPVWQRGYYEHIIRHDDELRAIREYILYNPLKWAEDVDNPAVFTRKTSQNQ